MNLSESATLIALISVSSNLRMILAKSLNAEKATSSNSFGYEGYTVT